MKKLLILLAILTTVAATAQSVGINTDGSATNASAMLDISSTTKGFLPPRMTGAQRVTITSPAQGLMIYCIDCGTLGEIQVYNGTTWTNMIGGAVTIPSNTIGTQVWSTTNLDVATYSDGTVIPQETDQTIWAGLTTGAWCYYNNDPAYGAIYGKLYNWHAVAGIWDEASKTDTSLRKKLAPTGWHVPTDTEWTTLTNALGGLTVAGGKMKATSTTLWTSPNTNATNESGFSGIPGGFRISSGPFFDIGSFGYWWSSSSSTTTNAWYRYLYYGNGNATRGSGNRKNGLSVRCLRDY